MTAIIDAAKNLQIALDCFVSALEASALHTLQRPAEPPPAPRPVPTEAEIDAAVRVTRTWDREFGSAPTSAATLLALPLGNPLAEALAEAGGRPLLNYGVIGLGTLLGRLSRLPGSRLRHVHTTKSNLWRLADRKA